MRIRITGARLEPTLAEFGLFKQAVGVPPPVFSQRDAAGAVTIEASVSTTVVYTIDGTAPTERSPVYRSPLVLPQGGTLQAAALTAQGKLGLVAAKTYVGVVPAGWKISSVDGQEIPEAIVAAAAAIDGSPTSFWEDRRVADAARPHSLTVDLGAPRRIGGFAYLPRQDGSLDGVVESYRVETSADGRTWTTQIDAGRFANIRNNPIFQEVNFAAVSARFLRFTVLQDVDVKGWASAAELTVLAAQP